MLLNHILCITIRTAVTAFLKRAAVVVRVLAETDGTVVKQRERKSHSGELRFQVVQFERRIATRRRQLILGWKLTSLQGLFLTQFDHRAATHPVRQVLIHQRLQADAQRLFLSFAMVCWISLLLLL